VSEEAKKKGQKRMKEFNRRRTNRKRARVENDSEQAEARTVSDGAGAGLAHYDRDRRGDE